MDYEIKINKAFCVLFSILYGSLLVLSLALSIHFAYLIVRIYRTADSVPKGIIGIMFGLLMIAIFLSLAKFVLAEFISFIKFYDIKIILQRDGIKIKKGQCECHIKNDNSQVVYCMVGWLIIWPSGESKNMILLRKGFLNKHCKKVRQYLKQDMDYISAKEKKYLLQSLNINIHNPLKYIKLPLELMNSNEKPQGI